MTEKAKKHMTCKPSEDERYSTRYPAEREKWRKDACRELRQFEALRTVLDRNGFSLACLIVCDPNRRGMSGDELRFAAKGLVRCALAGHDDGKSWRRLFGGKKDHWVKDGKKAGYAATPEIKKQLAACIGNKALFDTWKALDEKASKGLPDTWKSRVLLHACGHPKALRAWVDGCPLRRWCGPAGCPLAKFEVPKAAAEGPFMLLQVHDHFWCDGRKLSDCLRDAFNTMRPWVLVAQGECPAPRGMGGTGPAVPVEETDAGAKISSLNWPLRVAWTIENLSPLCTGLSQDFAKSFHSFVPGQVTRNLVLRPSAADAPTPALLVSSLRGVMRSAVAWLLEAIHRRNTLSTADVITSDYGRPGAKPCPMARIFGEAPDETGVETASLHSSQRSPVRFFVSQSAGGSFAGALAATATAGWDTRPLRYGRQVIAHESGNVRIETIQLGPDVRLVAEISGGPHALPALVALCLAADLLSSGFFRFGRFTSRGYGVMRLQPAEITSLAAWYAPSGGDTAVWPNGGEGVTTGLDLLRELGIPDPLATLAEWLKIFDDAGKEGEDAD